MKKTLWYGGLSLALVGLALTLFLTWAHVNGSLGRVCGEGSACQSVLTSSWATIAGLPTAFFGFVFYLVFFTALLVYPLTRNEGRTYLMNGLLAVSSVAFLVSLGLMSYSLVGLSSVCIYCSTSFALVTILFMGSLFWWIRGSREGELPEINASAWQGVSAVLGVLFLVALGLTVNFYLGTAAASNTQRAQETRLLTFDERAVGQPDAPIRVVEFFDLECPACQQFTRQVFPRIKRQYIDTGKVLWTFRPFPIDSHHPHAVEAHTALSMVPPSEYLSAKKQIMNNASQWVSQSTDDPTPFLKSVLADYGLQDVAFPDEMRDHLLERRNFYNRMGVSRTPSFLVNGRLIGGGRPFPFWQRYFERILNESGGQ